MRRRRAGGAGVCVRRRYFIRGQNERAAATDYVVAARRRAKLQQFDRLLKKFRHREALTAALATGRADVVASVVQELMTRGALPQVRQARPEREGGGHRDGRVTEGAWGRSGEGVAVLPWLRCAGVGGPGR